MALNRCRGRGVLGYRALFERTGLESAAFADEVAAFQWLAAGVA